MTKFLGSDEQNANQDCNLPNRKYSKGEYTREKILQGALDLFCEFGFHKSSTRQLVRKIGVSTCYI